MLKKYLTRPPALLGLLIILLAISASWQWLQVAQLGQYWQQFPQRSLAIPVADYAEQATVRALLAEDKPQLQQLVTELTHAELISSAFIYDNNGQLFAESDTLQPESISLDKDADKSIVQDQDIDMEDKEDEEEDQSLHQAMTTAEVIYIRPLYQADTPVGFLRLQLSNNAIALAQRTVWQQLTHHLSWMIPLCLLLGLLLGIAIARHKQ